MFVSIVAEQWRRRGKRQAGEGLRHGIMGKRGANYLCMHPFWSSFQHVDNRPGQSSHCRQVFAPGRTFLHNRCTITLCNASNLPPLQYPYRDIEKFKQRSHRFIISCLIPAGLTLYLGLEIALASVINAEYAFTLAAVPFIMTYIFFRLKK